MVAWNERIEKSCEGMGEGSEEGKDGGGYKKEVLEEVIEEEGGVGEGAVGWAEYGKCENGLEEVWEGEGHDLKKGEREREGLKKQEQKQQYEKPKNRM